jgi:hypothetical protein
MPTEFSPPRESSIPKEEVIVSPKTGKVIGVEVKKAAVDVETGEIFDEIEEKSEPKAKKSKIATTFYNLETLEGDKLKVAETYLLANNAKRVTETHWKSPIRLEKLTSCIDEGFNE